MPRVLVPRSYINLLLWNSQPDVPKLITFPFISVKYTIPVPHRVQYARAKATPPTTSFAIS